MDMKKKATSKGLRRVVGLLFLLAAIVSMGPAQQEQGGGLLQGGSVTNYRFAAQGELSITVCLLGAVRAPGRYEISRSIDLLNLLALAGGWTELADLADVRINRLSETSGQTSRRNFKLDITEFQDVARTYLTLQDGDFIYVGTKSGITIQEVMTYVTTAAILVTTYLTVSNQISP